MENLVKNFADFFVTVIPIQNPPKKIRKVFHQVFRAVFHPVFHKFFAQFFTKFSTQFFTQFSLPFSPPKLPPRSDQNQGFPIGDQGSFCCSNIGSVLFEICVHSFPEVAPDWFSLVCFRCGSFFFSAQCSLARVHDFRIRSFTDSST